MGSLSEQSRECHLRGSTADVPQCDKAQVAFLSSSRVPIGTKVLFGEAESVT